MILGLRQVAEIFGVDENQILEWINERNLPSDLVGDQYIFHRADLLEWAAHHRQPFSPTIYKNVNGDLTTAGTHLADALRAGGVLQNVAGENLREVLDSALDDLPIPDSVGRNVLIDLFLSRESMGSTAIGNGIAIPHPRQPVLLTVPEAVVRLCYLDQPLDIDTPDGKPVDKLFLMICPTGHEHLQLLARLGALLQSEKVRDALQNRLSGESLFSLLREEGRWLQEEDSGAEATT